MAKKWVKRSENQYSFQIGNSVIVQMEFNFHTLERKAVAKYATNEILIKKVGFWKNEIEILENNVIVAKVNLDKWFANSYSFIFRGKRLKLILRNNPLAEWAMLENENEVLAYGLNTEHGKPCLKRSSSNAVDEIIFDILLWYLFVPIATENLESEFTFLDSSDV